MVSRLVQAGRACQNRRVRRLPTRQETDQA